VLLIPLAFAGWFGMNNIPTDEVDLPPLTGSKCLVREAGHLGRWNKVHPYAATAL